MPILSAHIVPHPPLAVPSIGHGREKEIQDTLDGFMQTARDAAAQRPDTLIITTPHSVMYADYFHISPGPRASGSFASFQAPSEVVSAAYDEDLSTEIARFADGAGIPAGSLGQKDPALDHGVMVPLYYINQAYADYQIVRISLSGLPYAEHYRLGQCIRQAVEATGRRAVFIASGDLSHKLKADGPYGFSPQGPAFDKETVEAMKKADFIKWLTFDEAFCDSAAECGLRSFIIMAGALDGLDVETAFHSYEGPFGVGYATCRYTVGSANPARHFLAEWENNQNAAREATRKAEGPYVSLARASLETFVKEGRRIPCPSGLPAEMESRQAGVFVSLKINGRLRGCIGTIAPTAKNIALEILQNAISAGTRDPRFDPVKESELPLLTYSVDVLSPPELIPDSSFLDVKKYGVIVSAGHKRGLLLPNLDGVDTVTEQLAIAMQKGGISPSEAYRLERFEVVRHR